MEISTALSLCTVQADPGGATAPLLIVNEVARDRLLYDAGQAFGTETATIPVSGIAAEDDVVEVRALSVDDGGASCGAWVEMAPALANGSWSGQITARRNASWYRIEARLKLQPAVKASSFNRFGVGHVIAIWGQSEVALFWQASHSNTPLENLTTKFGLLRLKDKSGRKSTATLKVPGVDALPVGSTSVGDIVTLNGLNGVTLSDWDFRQKGLALQNCTNVTLRNCLFGGTPVAGVTTGYLDIYATSSDITVEKCDFTGPSAYGGKTGVHCRTSGSGAGAVAARTHIRDCRFFGLTGDAVKWAGGVIERCYFKWTTNIDAAVLGEWSAATSYALGDHITYLGNRFKSLLAANLNNTPPLTPLSNANWQSVDPHVDAISPVCVIGNSVIRDNYIDMVPTDAARLVGLTNFFRLVREPGADLRFDQIVVENNLCDWVPGASAANSVSDSGLANYVKPLIRGNWLMPSAGGLFLHPSNGTLSGIEWTDNRRTDTEAAVAVPPNCMAGSWSRREDEAVQMLWRTFDTTNILQHKHVRNGDAGTSAFTVMANTVMAECVGQKFAFVHHSSPGTDPRQLVNDSDPARMWSDDLALHQLATAGGSNVGLAAMSWFASPGNLAANYGAAMFPLFSGETLAGATVSFPSVINYGAGTYQADHWFGEIYTYTKTKWIPYGPHRFDIRNDMQDATHALGGAIDNLMDQKEQSRVSWRAMLGNVNATMFTGLGLEPLTYVNGYPDGLGDWTDMAHARDNVTDGVPRLARLTVHAILQASGLTSWQIPQFDQCTWNAGGAYVEVGSSAGPITTVRRARSEATLPGTFPHWTEVAGWQIDGAPADRAEVVAGKVRIFPQSGSFTAANSINFGQGGATGMILRPEDYDNALWKDVPIVELGLYGLEGAEVRTLPAPAVLANTIPAVAASYRITGATPTSPRWQDPATSGAGITGLTFEAKITFRTGTGTGFYQLFTCSDSTVLGVEVRPSTAGMRIQAKDSAGTVVVAQTSVAGVLLAQDTQQTIRAAINYVSGQQWLKLFVNGTQVASQAFGVAGSGSFATNRNLMFFQNTHVLVADVEYLRVWKSATSDGSLPGGAPFTEVLGPAATANAHPWKLGNAAT
jgi:hypothetical protein